jgi:hypothetical protein
MGDFDLDEFKRKVLLIVTIIVFISIIRGEPEDEDTSIPEAQLYTEPR